MYSLETPLDTVKGVGPSISKTLAARNFLTVKDLVLFVPLRYEDRSLKKMIYQLIPNEVVTIEAEVVTSNNYYKGRRSIQSATVKDHTGRVKLMWFNNPHIVNRLQNGQKLFISGKLNDKGIIVQPTVETVSNNTTHTGRLVPIYSVIPNLAPATFRKILKHILDNLDQIDDHLRTFSDICELRRCLTQIHFPDSEESIISARERLALEELLMLIEHSHHLKKEWQIGNPAHAISTTVQPQLPFTLTTAQQRCVQEILTDLDKKTPMNRLLIGDVGSGKTAVAGMACAQALAAGYHCALVAPTQILAEQHYVTLQKLFPTFHVQLLTAKQKFDENKTAPTLYIGTHAVLHHLKEIQPALLIYDEQHRFGVAQRSAAQHLPIRPHILTLSATPIPRTLMLSIFSHLQLSMIDEMPPGRKVVKTWVVPEQKREDAYVWLTKELKASTQFAQCLVVCPFIDQSESDGLQHIAAATEMFAKLQKTFAKSGARLALLHGRLAKNDQQTITKKLYAQEIDVLVTTPIVEVGLDLPAATIIIIEAAERFGLASLHQMRGRVGRAGQEAYCLLFTNAKNGDAHKRLKEFSQTHNGMKLAEQDLQRRGAGDIFGTQQHGFDELQFANWSNLELTTKAKMIADTLEKSGQLLHPFLTLHHVSGEDIPLAN